MGLILKLNKKDYPEDTVGEFLIGMQVFNLFMFAAGITLLVPCCRKRMHRWQRERDHKRKQTVIQPVEGDGGNGGGDGGDGGGGKKGEKGDAVVTVDSESDSDSSDDEDTKQAAKNGMQAVKKPGMVSGIL
jgi:hypothetical protein